MAPEYQSFEALIITLGRIAVLAFVIERVCDFVLDYYPVRLRIRGIHGVKALLPLALSLALCLPFDIDIVAALYSESSRLSGEILTAFFMAGGSGAAMTLFSNVLKISQSQRRAKLAEAEAEKKQEELRLLTQYRNSYTVDKTELQSSFHKTLSIGSQGNEVIELQKLLLQFGYLEHPFQVGTIDNTTSAALTEYQKRRHLSPDGIVGKITALELNKKRCGVSDNTTKHANAATSACRWPGTDITYCIENLAPEISEERCRTLIQEAFQAWETVSQLRFSEVGLADSPQIRIGWYSPDVESVISSLRVYGYGYDPCHGSRQGRILLDNAEPWLDDDIPTNNYGFYIRLTVTHEIGHALGLDHSNNHQDIMHDQPDLAGLRGLSNNDANRINQLYT